MSERHPRGHRISPVSVWRVIVALDVALLVTWVIILLSLDDPKGRWTAILLGSAVGLGILGRVILAYADRRDRRPPHAETKS